MASKSLLESINPKGHLEIIKKYSDGHEETVLNDHNVITAGMGITLAHIFANTSLTVAADSFSIGNFQIGTTSGAMVSSTIALTAPISEGDYGDTDLTLNTIFIAGTGNQISAVINPVYISKTTSTKVTYSLVLEEAAANGLSVQEIGLFSRNPGNHAPAVSYLCAYRSFAGISKNGSFALIFKWTLEF